MALLANLKEEKYKQSFSAESIHILIIPAIEAKRDILC
jgi:hypothetical protein